MKRFLTGLITADYDRFKPPPYRGLGWRVELAEATKHYGELRPTSDGEYIEIRGMELVIHAPTEAKANHALFLIMSAIELWSADVMPFRFGYEPAVQEITERPATGKTRNEQAPPTFYTSNIPWACQIAAAASRKLDHICALAKWKLSMQTYSTPHIDLDPQLSPTLPRQKHISYSVAFAYAIILAYSVIEQLKLEIRASRENPRSVKDATGKDTWGIAVREDLEKRLTDAGVDLSEQVPWMARGKRTLIESEKPKFIHSNARRAGWNQGDARDQLVDMADAIARGICKSCVWRFCRRRVSS
jgi:hypothetical protein